MPRHRNHRSLPIICPPYWTTARFNSTCSCGKKIQVGDKIFYRGKSRTLPAKAVCEKCGIPWEYDIKAEESMEQYGTDIMFDC